MNMDYAEQLRQFMNPDLLRKKLITASVFIAVYENFKAAIVDNVKYFFVFRTRDGKEVLDEYEKNVLSKVSSKKNRQIRATLLWYKENGAINEQDIMNFNSFTDMRNTFSHSLYVQVFEGLPENTYNVYFEMISLYDKMTKWWIVNIEIPTDPDITAEQYEEIDWGSISSVALEFIKIMTDIAFTGNEQYLEQLKKTT